MHTFYPSFFNTLSKNDISSLIKHEDWIMEIFGSFWELVLNKFEKPPLGDHWKNRVRDVSLLRVLTFLGFSQMMFTLRGNLVTTLLMRVWG